MELEHKKIYCQIVAQLLIADAVLTDEEREFLERLMDRLGLDTDAKADVINSVNIGDPVEDKIQKVPPGARGALLEELRAAAMVDGELAPREAGLIETVEKALSG